MSDIVTVLVSIGPLALAGVALLALLAGRRGGDIFRLSRFATWLNLAMAAVAAAAVVAGGAMQSGLLGLNGFGLAVRLDAISTTIFALIAFVGVVVVEYSRNYLAGDRRQGAFLGEVCLALAAVSMLVLSGNLVQLVLGWVAASLAVHRLMVFYPGRPAAVIAARKKFIVARIGDVCVGLAAALLVMAFDTADLAQIAGAARAQADAGDFSALVPAAAILIAIAALLKSAQFPVHGWLLGVMEAPTPVSALLHAGIVNAGGFLVIRMADVVVISPAAMYTLAIVGGTTALIGSVVMLTQTSAKVSLAWSTVAQMGFMLFQCGLGAFSMAMLHILAHSLYKAHAFLSAGSAVTAGSAPVSLALSRGPVAKGFALIGAGLAAITGGALAFDLPLFEKPSMLVLEVVFVLSLLQLLMRAAHEGGILRHAALRAAALATLYIGLQALAAFAMSPALPPVPSPTPGTLAIVAVALVAFPAALFVQWLAPQRTHDPRWQAAYVHLRNGLYATALFNRAVDGMRVSGSRPRKEVA